ncbi:MAG TPA: hypothetical protein PK624_11000 [Spirochaetota bacterium]|nr:hypothetical protein [Spirochaetota bacterium]HOR45312.1 hypothetical protein [Spirochaetota bacterium]HPK56620.1 hypothetical protein [Spirochaetota bacterium]
MISNIWRIDKTQTNLEFVSIILNGELSKIRLYRDKTSIKKLIPQEYSEYEDKFNVLFIDDEETPICATKDKELAITLLRASYPASYAWKMLNKESVSELEKFSLSEYSTSYREDLKFHIEKSIDAEVSNILNNKFKEFSQHFNRKIIDYGEIQEYTIYDLLKTVPVNDILDVEMDCETFTIENNPFIPGAFNIILPNSSFLTGQKSNMSYKISEEYILLTLIPFNNKAILLGKSYLNKYSSLTNDSNIIIKPTKFTPYNIESYEQLTKLFFEHYNKRRSKNIIIQKEFAIVSCKEPVFREKPDIKSAVLESGSFLFGQNFVVISKSGKKSKINGVEEYWYQCRSNKGWIFGGDIIRTKFEPFIKNFNTEIILKNIIAGGGNDFFYTFSPIVIGDIFIAYIYHNEYLPSPSDDNKDDIPANGLMIGKFSEEKGFFKFSKVIKIAGYSINGEWINDPSKFSESYSSFKNFNCRYASYSDEEGVYFQKLDEKYAYNIFDEFKHSRQYYRDLKDDESDKSEFVHEFFYYEKCHYSDVRILSWLRSPTGLNDKETVFKNY